MDHFTGEYLVKEWETVSNPSSGGTHSMHLNDSGRFFVIAVAGDIDNPDTGKPIEDKAIIAKNISDIVIQFNWESLPLPEIAQNLSDQMRDLPQKQRQGLRELHVSLMTNSLMEDESSVASSSKTSSADTPLKIETFEIV